MGVGGPQVERDNTTAAGLEAASQAEQFVKQTCMLEGRKGLSFSCGLNDAGKVFTGQIFCE